jgi:hypothetical protein
MPNPSLRLDPALGLVVLEFRDAHGRRETLPTERELAAYRSAGGRRQEATARLETNPAPIVPAPDVPSAPKAVTPPPAALAAPPPGVAGTP